MFLLIHIPFYSLSYCRIIFIIEAKFKVNNFKNTAIMFVPFRYWFWCRILDVSKVCMWNKVSEIWVIEQNLITHNGAPSLSQLSFTDISSSFKCDQMGDSWYQTNHHPDRSATLDKDAKILQFICKCRLSQTPTG